MNNRTKFYEILVGARIDNKKLIFVIEKIMPLIKKYSKIDKSEIDEHSKSYLIEYAIKIIKQEDFADKFIRK